MYPTRGIMSEQNGFFNGVIYIGNSLMESQNTSLIGSHIIPYCFIFSLTVYISLCLGHY